MSLLPAVLAAAVVCQVALLCTTVYLHRTLSHRALTLHPGAAFAFRAVLWVTTGIQPREWVAVHRKHHAFSDEEGDPHSPLLEGFAMVQFANVRLYRRALKGGEIIGRYARDLPPDRWDRLVFDRGWIGLGVGVVLLSVVLGPVLGLVAATLHAVTYLLINAAINAIGHAWGRQPHDNKARNNQWLALLSGGEGLHNNHHAAPTSATLALRRREIDPGWWLIRALQRGRLATIRLERERVQERLAS